MDLLLFCFIIRTRMYGFAIHYYLLELTVIYFLLIINISQNLKYDKYELKLIIYAMNLLLCDSTDLASYQILSDDLHEGWLLSELFRNVHSLISWRRLLASSPNLQNRNQFRKESYLYGSYLRW